MFTSEPSLAQRIERMISDTPKIDLLSRITCDRPSVPDLASLINESGVRTELRAVGMTDADFDPSLPAEERVRLSIPFLRRIRNTAAAWCLHRIFRELYDFHDPDLTETNYRDLLDNVTASRKNSAWPDRVLKDACNIQTFVTGLSSHSASPSKNSADVRFCLDLSSLFRTDSLGISSVVGDLPATAASLGQRLNDWLDKSMTEPVRFSEASLPSEARFVPPDLARTDAALALAASRRPLNSDDADAIFRFVTWQVFGWHHEHAKAILLHIEAGRSLVGDRITAAFQHFGRARFHLLAGSDLVAWEVDELARAYPNVSVSGYGNDAFFPAAIEATVGRRLQTIPMTKIGGFFSLAESVEWSYGRLQLERKSIAAAFARLVASGYYDEDEVPSLLRQILHDTPRDLLDLGPRE